MVDLSYKDFKDNMAGGSPDMLSRVADVARQAACNIYSKSPAAWLANEIPGTPLLDAHRALMDTLCDGVVPPPPPPPPPFTGGQCACQMYSVNGTYRDKDFPNRINNFSTPVLAGKIGGVISVRPVAGTSPTAYALFLDYSINCGETKSWQLTGTDTRPDYFTSWKVTQIVPSPAGTPDLCGNPPGYYPPPNVTVGDYDFNTNVTFSPGVSVSTSVSITPTLVVNDNKTGPEINVNVGGINVSASLGGFTFSPTINFGGGDRKPSFDPRPNPPPARTPSPPPGGGPSADDIKGIQDDLDDIKDRLDDDGRDKKPTPPPTPEKVAVTVLITGNSGSVALPAATFKVTLEIIERASQEKIQFGMQATDVLYAGWAWFSGASAMNDRMPVDAVNKVFVPPTRVTDSFQFTLYKGYRAIIRAYYITN